MLTRNQVNRYKEIIYKLRINKHDKSLVKIIYNRRCFVMFVCLLFRFELKWPKIKSFRYREIYGDRMNWLQIESHSGTM